MKDCTMHRHPRKWRQRGKWVTASVPSDSDASIVANRPWKPAKSRDIPFLPSSLLSLLPRKKKYPLFDHQWQCCLSVLSSTRHCSGRE